MTLVLRLTAVTILVVSLTLMLGPFGGAEAGSGISDKAAHFVVFGLILWSFGVLFRRLPRLWAAAAAVGLGAAVEVVQGLVGRDASWGDLLADALGVGFALLLWVIWRRFKPRTEFQTSNTR
jgi:VanZ family protein